MKSVFYSNDTLEKMYDAKNKYSSFATNLRLKFHFKTYKNDKSSEYVRNGLSRRIKTLIHLIDRVFTIIPPNSERRPPNEARHDAEAFIQSFLINVYGSIDNMAKIWCLESDIRNKKGNPIPDGMIGFWPKCELVRNSLPDDFRNYLVECDPWFEYLENYRHAVAHRIPVYIPPSVLDDQGTKEYKRINNEITKAYQKQSCDSKINVDSINRYQSIISELTERREALSVFKPIMTHSFGENARPVTIHEQMICDIASVVEIGERLLKILPNPCN